MNKKILIGSILALTILILPSSIVIGVDDTKPENNLKITYIPPYVFTLIIGKISNLTLSGGWTPCYNFHIDKGLTLSTFIPFFRIRYDCNARIVIPSFSGIIKDSFIFGITYAVHIYQ